MSELLRLRDRVKKAEIWYLEKVSKTAARGFKNDAVNLRRSWGNGRLIFWSVSELGGAIDVSKRKALYYQRVQALRRTWKRCLPLPRSLVKFACAPTLGSGNICYLSGGDEVIE
jgi:hypothetical protein